MGAHPLTLAGKVALVTGAGRGIGRAIALELARDGAIVAVNYARNAEAANSAVSEIAAAGGRAIAVQADVAVADQVDTAVKKITTELGPIEILVNNAGVTRDRLILRMTEEDWDTVVDTDLKGAFLATRAVAAGMVRRRSGTIVNVGSVVGIAGGAGQANYSAAKAGLIGLTKSLARELGGRNIRVNAVAPGFVETDMTQDLKAEYRDAIVKQVPLGRLGTVEDIAGVVSFLCSPKAAYIHGAVITIDGGLFM